ncbi:MAG: ParA family protein [Nitrospirae bacterium]|nr:MAG: ParA family protein [Nitrospirota bacterium]
MAKIVAIANQKGGVGKTTTSINLSAALAILGHSVLLVDLDPQANATSGMGIEQPKTTVYDCFTGRISISEAIISTKIKGLSMIPSSVDLVGVEVELTAAPNRERVLRDLLENLGENFAWIVLDCPPALGLITINALVAAHSVLVPVQCEYYAMEGLGWLMSNMDRIRESWNPLLELEGIVLTMYDSRINLARQVSEEIRSFFREKVFRTVIPRNVSLAEAPSYGQPALVYNSASSGARAYMELAGELLNHGKTSTR